ncbi:MAG: anti-sigma factor, partial [Phycicoccus sp.]
EPAGEVIASARLDTLDTKSAKGSAEFVRTGTATDLSVSTEPIDAGSGYVEVWLINRDLKRMVSVGVLAPGAGSQTFAVPQSLVDDGYVVVDISREPLDGNSTHSGDSVVRGTLGV